MTIPLGLYRPEAISLRAGDGPKFYANLLGASHIGSVTSPGDHSKLYQALSTAWFRCYLSQDQSACELFSAGDCSKFGLGKSVANKIDNLHFKQRLLFIAVFTLNAFWYRI